MPTLTVSLLIAVPVLALVATGVWLYFAFRRDLETSRRRLRGASRVVATASGPVEYAERGTGEPVLVIHGAGGGFDQGLEIARPLANSGFRIIAMSRFGYLRTPQPADASPAAQADAHAHLLDALGIQCAAVIGGSAGAPSAMQFAIRYPERCAALVLAVPITYKPPEVPASAPEISPAAEKILMTIVGSDFVYWLASKFARNTVIKRVLATPPAVVRSAASDEQTRVRRILQNILPISSRTRGIVNDARMAVSLTRYELEKIHAPTLVLSVRDDGYGTFAGGVYTASHISGASFVGYDSGGHMWVGRQDQMFSEIARFLQSNLAHVPAEAVAST